MMVINRLLERLFWKPTSIYPLVSFRVIFGLGMLVSTIRFWVNGWIFDLYIKPDFFFKYFGFSFIVAPSDTLIYLLFIIVGLCSLFIALGLFYRFSIISFFLVFTYIELIDVSNYLNHYYFISLIAFIMIWLPANRLCALDLAIFKKIVPSKKIQAWQLHIIFFQIAVLYFFAGLAKLNYDWIILSQPMKIWLAAQSDFPFIGWLFKYEWIAVAMGICGALFDLTIVFWLLWKRSRIPAYLILVFFHCMTALLFPIGMFPYFMIGFTLVFFSAKVHELFWKRISPQKEQSQIPTVVGSCVKYCFVSGITVYVCLQLFLPMRFLFYDNLFWTEDGYRFSWRVMLMEKAGYAQFKVVDNNTQVAILVNNSEFLAVHQEKMMATQPDLIIQYAKHLATEFKKRGFDDPLVYAEAYVSINGRRSKLYFPNDLVLNQLEYSFKPTNWLNPYP